MLIQVKNLLQMQGITSLPLFKKDETGNLCFDFNQLISMPESLGVESGAHNTDQAIVYYVTERGTIAYEELGEEAKNILCRVPNFISGWLHPKQSLMSVQRKLENSSQTERDQLYEEGRRYVKNIEQHGAPTWYEWRCRHWNTSWNAYKLDLSNDDIIVFHTKLHAPIPIYEQLAKQYPDRDFEVWYAEEEMGLDTGHIVYREGVFQHHEFLNRSCEAYQTYVKCWNDTSCLRQGVGGEWYPKRCRECNECSKK